MAYEKIKLVCAFMSGDIYMARIKEDGSMDMRNRRVATDDVIRASAEWFIKNKKTVAHFKGAGTLAWIPEQEDLSPKEIKEYIDKLKKLEDNND